MQTESKEKKSMQIEPKEKEMPGKYILTAMRHHFLGGDCFILKDELFGLCRAEHKNLEQKVFERDKASLTKSGRFRYEGQRLYLIGLWKHEQDAAMRLAELLNHNELNHPYIPSNLKVGDMTLLPEQRDAVVMALSNRMSIVLGGAGCGKTTLIRAIAQYGNRGVVACAPTGKAAQNLRQRIGISARTVHSALGKGYEEDDKEEDESLPPINWPYIQTVIIDEASMLTLSLLDGILSVVPNSCSVVLVGDTKQLQSVGSGNVLFDLLKLGCPSICLRTNHRQVEGAVGLYHNVTNFENINSLEQLTMDESFSLEETDDHRQAVISITEKAVELLGEGRNFQVVASQNATVDDLNRHIQQVWNPKREGVLSITYEGKCYRCGDKVIITRNDTRRRCYNGDIGTLIIFKGEENTDDPQEYQFGVLLSNERFPTWVGADALENLELAYAITIHKAQGSEFDDVLIPMTMECGRMLYRNLFYTATSRARRRVTIYGSKNAVEVALKRMPPPRRSMLVTKTRNRMENCAN